MLMLFGNAVLQPNISTCMEYCLSFLSTKHRVAGAWFLLFHAKSCSLWKRVQLFGILCICLTKTIFMQYSCKFICCRRSLLRLAATAIHTPVGNMFAHHLICRVGKTVSQCTAALIEIYERSQGLQNSVCSLDGKGSRLEALGLKGCVNTKQ